MSGQIAVVLGVGALQGLGAALCRRAAKDGYTVVVSGRTASRINAVRDQIVQGGGTAASIVADVTDESQIQSLFTQIGAMDGVLSFVGYNAGNAFSGDTLSMTAEYFEQAWRVCCLGGFLTAREAGNRLADLGAGTIVFTGATASIRARPPFLAFASAKAGLRAVAATFARELGPRGVHVAHAIIDGGIEGERLLSKNPSLKDKMGEHGMLHPDAIAESYWQLHLQHPSAWSFEIDLRPFKESF